MVDQDKDNFPLSSIPADWFLSACLFVTQVRLLPLSRPSQWKTPHLQEGFVRRDLMSLFNFSYRRLRAYYIYQVVQTLGTTAGLELAFKSIKADLYIWPIDHAKKSRRLSPKFCFLVFSYLRQFFTEFIPKLFNIINSRVRGMV